jgi:hypothetical protein
MLMWLVGCTVHCTVHCTVRFTVGWGWVARGGCTGKLRRVGGIAVGCKVGGLRWWLLGGPGTSHGDTWVLTVSLNIAPASQQVRHQGILEKRITRRCVSLPTNTPLRNSLIGSPLPEIPSQRDPRARERFHEHEINKSSPAKGAPEGNVQGKKTELLSHVCTGHHGVGFQSFTDIDMQLAHLHQGQLSHMCTGHHGVGGQSSTGFSDMTTW